MEDYRIEIYKKYPQKYLLLVQLKTIKDMHLQCKSAANRKLMVEEFKSVNSKLNGL